MVVGGECVCKCARGNVTDTHRLRETLCTTTHVSMITCDKKVRLSFETKLRNMRVDLHVAVIDAEQRLAPLTREFINRRRILLAEGGLPTHEVVKERCAVAREKG